MWLNHFFTKKEPNHVCERFSMSKMKVLISFVVDYNWMHIAYVSTIIILQHVSASKNVNDYVCAALRS